MVKPVMRCATSGIEAQKTSAEKVAIRREGMESVVTKSEVSAQLCI